MAEVELALKFSLPPVFSSHGFRVGRKRWLYTADAVRSQLQGVRPFALVRKFTLMAP